MLWFDAWVYARQEEALWRALLLRVVDALRAKLLDLPEFRAIEKERNEAIAELDEAQMSLYRSMTLKEKGGLKVNWWGALPFAADAALSALTAGLNAEVAKAMSGDDKATGVTAAITKWFKGGDTKEVVKLIEREASEHYVAQVVSLEQFHVKLLSLLKRFGIGPDRKLFIFVDDLDRCLPEDAVAALEAIKLFLNLEGCVFILGMDREVVEQGIRVRYKDLGPAASFEPRQYLDKIIQIPFTLPPLGPDQISRYLWKLGNQSGHEAALICEEMIRIVAPANPRAFKRILNILQLTLYLDGFDDARISQAKASPDKNRVLFIGKLVLMQIVFSSAYAALASDPLLVKEVEDFSDRRQNNLTDDQRKLFDTPALQKLLVLPPRFSQLSESEIRGLFTLSKITSSAPS